MDGRIDGRRDGSRRLRLITATLLSLALYAPQSSYALGLSQNRDAVAHIDLAGFDLSGQWIAFTQYTSRATNDQVLKVMSLDSGGPREIGPSKWTGGAPRLSDELLAYATPSNEGDVRIIDLASERTWAPADSNGVQSNPDVDGEYAVWQDYRAGNWDVYCKNLETGAETPLATSPAAESGPRISLDNVIWRNGADRGLYYRSILSEDPPVCLSKGGNTGNNDINGNRIVWVEDSAKIYLHDLDTGETKSIYPGTATVGSPVIDGDLVVFEIRESDYGDLAVYDLTTDTLEVLKQPRTEWGPRLCEGRILYGAYTPGAAFTDNNLAIAKIDNQQDTDSALSASRSNIAYGQTATLTVTLTAGDAPLSLHEVEIWSAVAGGPWKQAGSTTTDANGVATWAVKPGSITSYQARFMGLDSYRESTSNTIKVKVSAVLTKPLLPARVKKNVAVSVSGSVAPAHATKVTLTVYRSSGTKFRSVTLKTSSGGRYSTKLSFPKGSYKIRTTHADTGHVLSKSPYRVFVVK